MDTIRTTVELGDGEYECLVEYTYYPATRGSRGSYGEPMEPDEDAYIEIGAVLLDGHDRYDELTPNQLYYIEQEIMEDIESSRCAWEEDRADAIREDRLFFGR